MRGVILAAGEGSRMGEYTDDRPKTFLELQGRTLYERQRDLLTPHVDEVTVVLGYEAEAVRGDLEHEDRALIFEEWQAYENGASLRYALADICSQAGGPQASPGSVIVLNGDVIVAPDALERLCRHQRRLGETVVGCFPGHQREHTAVRCDQDGRVTDYGELPGHRHAGLGIIDGSDVVRARRFLREHRSEWYPVIYPELGARRIFLPEQNHIEINRPAHLRTARQRLPFDGADGTIDTDTERASTGDGQSS